MTKPAMNTSLVKVAKTTFIWDDPLLLDGQLDVEERMVRDMAHEYA